MMGHTIGTYNETKMKGIDYLRNLYASSGLSTRPKTQISKVERVKIFAESLGLNPDESRDALAMVHRTIVDPDQRKIEVLNRALKEAMLKELRMKKVFSYMCTGLHRATITQTRIYPVSGLLQLLDYGFLVSLTILLPF